LGFDLLAAWQIQFGDGHIVCDRQQQRVNIRSTTLDLVYNETTTAAPRGYGRSIVPDILSILEDVMTAQLGCRRFFGQCQAEHSLTIVESQPASGMGFAG